MWSKKFPQITGYESSIISSALHKNLFSARCFLPQDSGDCDADFMMYMFDPKDQNCKALWYGGCGGNENKFDSRGECESICKVFDYEIE